MGMVNRKMSVPSKFSCAITFMLTYLENSAGALDIIILDLNLVAITAYIVTPMPLKEGYM